MAEEGKKQGSKLAAVGLGVLGGLLGGGILLGVAIRMIMGAHGDMVMQPLTIDLTVAGTTPYTIKALALLTTRMSSRKCTLKVYPFRAKAASAFNSATATLNLALPTAPTLVLPTDVVTVATKMYTADATGTEAGTITLANSALSAGVYTLTVKNTTMTAVGSAWGLAETATLEYTANGL